jgi:hypothetical protein
MWRFPLQNLLDYKAADLQVPPDAQLHPLNTLGEDGQFQVNTVEDA